jgi:hypothetical protein
MCVQYTRELLHNMKHLCYIWFIASALNQESAWGSGTEIFYVIGSLIMYSLFSAAKVIQRLHEVFYKTF